MDVRNQTRIGGIFYLVLIACGVYAEVFVIGRSVVANDAAATASNILANQGFYRSGVIAHIVTLALSCLLAGILYRIFKPTSGYVAGTIVVLNIVTIAIEGISIIYELQTLWLLKSKVFASVFSPDQVNAMAYMPLRMQNICYDLALLFFGLECCLIGILIMKSKLFLRWIGIAMVVAGLCYITNSVSSYISPPFRHMLLPFILIPCLIAELSLSINMIVRPGATKGT